MPSHRVRPEWSGLKKYECISFIFHPSQTKVAPTPPPLLKGGEGAGGGKVHSAYSRKSFTVEGNFSSPASPRLSRPVGKRRGGGKGAGRYIRHTAANPSQSKVISAPPPLLKGGEGVRGREGTFGNSAAMKNPYYLTINYTKKRGYPEG